MNINFNPGVDFENLINQAEFKLVASRIAQAATLKAEKAGKGTVDLAEAKKKANSSTSEGGGNKPSGDSSSTPSGGGSSEGDNAGLE